MYTHIYAHMHSHFSCCVLVKVMDCMNVVHRVILEICLITKNSSFLMYVIKEKVFVCKSVCVYIYIYMFQAYHIIFLCVYYSIHIIHITIFLTMDTENCTWIMCFLVFYFLQDILFICTVLVLLHVYNMYFEAVEFSIQFFSSFSIFLLLLFFDGTSAQLRTIMSTLLLFCFVFVFQSFSSFTHSVTIIFCLCLSVCFSLSLSLSLSLSVF